MAHECPVCSQICYCHGDIDDLILNRPKAIACCDHCSDAWIDEDEYEIIETEREITTVEF